MATRLSVRLGRAAVVSGLGGGIPGNGEGALYFASIVAAWLVLPAVVEFKNVLDAGCFFMLVSLGILVVVELAGQGQAPLPSWLQAGMASQR